MPSENQIQVEKVKIPGWLYLAAIAVALAAGSLRASGVFVEGVDAALDAVIGACSVFGVGGGGAWVVGKARANRRVQP